MNAASVARIMGGKTVLKRDVRSLSDLREAVAEGLPVRALNRTAEYIAASRREATRLKDRLVPPATRKRRKTTLKPGESERVERVARVMAMAEEVWEDRESAKEFVATPHPLLKGRTPLELAQTELGAREVELLLHELDHTLPL